MSALNIASRALTTNLAALQVVGNNIANVNTEGYSRQNVLLRTSGYQEFGNGFFGKGVEIATVTRNHDAYLTREANAAKSAASADGMRLSKLKQLEDLFPTGPTGLGASMNSMLNAWNDVASAPSNLTARTVVIARGDEFAARLRTTAAQLDQQQLGTELQVDSTVKSVNRLAQDLATVNQRILETQGSPHTPNDLFDQRDQLLSELNQYVKTSNVPSEGGTVSVFVGGSQPLVLGQTANQLVLTDDPADPTQKQLSFLQGGVSTPMDHKQLGGGELAGLMTYLREDLNPMKTRVDSMAGQLATEMNAQHRLGRGLDEGTGRNFFNIPTSAGVPAAANSLTSKADVSLTGLPVFPVPKYQLLITATGVDVTPDGGPTTSIAGSRPGSFSLNGLTFNVSAGATGDSFVFRPDTHLAKNLQMALVAPDQLAAASPVLVTPAPGNSTGLSVESLQATSPFPDPFGAGKIVTFNGTGQYQIDGGSPLPFTPGAPITGNGWSVTLRGIPGAGDSFTVAPAPANSTRQNAGNAIAVLALREKAMSGGVPLGDGYVSVISTLGTQVQSAKFAAEFTTQVANSTEKARSGAAGVNLDEEAARLLQFQQAYQASAKFLQIAQGTFDTLLQTVGR